jgi:NAD(P)-dependent dehydrogenase (short-subunit alcohol dehydrogenase family)
MQLVRNMAVELGPSNVRVNSIAPGVIRTDFARALVEDVALRKQVEDQSPLRRFGEPDDVAGLAVFLASPAGRYVTGQTLVVDGGGSIS